MISDADERSQRNVVIVADSPMWISSRPNRWWYQQPARMVAYDSLRVRSGVQTSPVPSGSCDIDRRKRA